MWRMRTATKSGGAEQEGNDRAQGKQEEIKRAFAEWIGRIPNGGGVDTGSTM